jgi:hypothetical protein
MARILSSMNFSLASGMQWEGNIQKMGTK